MGGRCGRRDAKGGIGLSGRWGFTLLEVLVALIIFSVAFGAIANLFQTALRQSTTASDRLEALALAELQIARFGAELPLEPGEAEGEAVSPGGVTLAWRSRIALAEPVGEDGIALYQIVVDIAEGAGGAPLISLETLRLGDAF